MSRSRIVVVGAGFAGHQAARTLSRQAGGHAEIVLLNPTDYFLYLPLLPQVAAGILEPRRVSVSLTATLPGVRLVLGEAGRVDLAGRRVHYTDPEGSTGELPYDRLVLAVGSVNKLLPVPGVSAYAHGFRGLPEALYLRDHLTRQIEPSYHLAAMPGNRVRVAADWLLDAALPRQAVQWGVVRSWSVPLDTVSPEQTRKPGAGPEPSR